MGSPIKRLMPSSGIRLASCYLRILSGFNLPKMGMARSKEELKDIATLEFSNTALTLLGSWFVPPVLKEVVERVSGVTIKHLDGELQGGLQKGGIKVADTALPKHQINKIKLARLAKSFGFFVSVCFCVLGDAVY